VSTKAASTRQLNLLQVWGGGWMRLLAVVPASGRPRIGEGDPGENMEGRWWSGCSLRWMV
jgi:hypothetical protein